MENHNLPYLFKSDDSSHTVNEPTVSYGYSNKITQIRRGMPVRSLYHFMKNTGLSKAELATILNISVRTLQRYQMDTVLPSTLTEKLLALHALYDEAKETLEGTPMDTTAWLKQKSAALSNATPLSLLDTYQGLYEVQNILGRVAHGVY